MTRDEVINSMLENHQEFQRVLALLSEEQITQVKVTDEWTVRDVIAHITAWNLEDIESIDDILAGRKPQNVENKGDEFNRQEINRRQDLSMDQMLHDWNNSFTLLMYRLEDVSDGDWYKRLDEKWSTGELVSIKSLFEYQYKGKDHEGGHLEEIKRVFGMV